MFFFLVMRMLRKHSILSFCKHGGLQTYLHLYHETTTVHSVRDLISIRIARSIQNLINTFYPHNKMLMQSCSEWAGSLSLTVDGSGFRAVAGVVWSDGRTGVQCMDEFQHFCWWWGSVQSPSKLHHIRGRSVSSHTQGRISALHHFSNWLRSKKITLKLWHIHTHTAHIQHVLWKETTSSKLQTWDCWALIASLSVSDLKPFIWWSPDYPSLHFLSQDLLKNKK